MPVHDDGMMLYRRPGNAVPLTEVPQLASWERAGHPSRVRLARFLDEVQAVAAPLVDGGSTTLALDLVVGADQYRRRWDGDNGESPKPPTPDGLADLPPILPGGAGGQPQQ
jgi:hypothetical protein